MPLQQKASGKPDIMGVTSRTGIISVISVISRTKFIHMIKVEFTNIESKFKINGFLSDTFILIRRVRQGCPPSMLLCIIVAEVLANFINKD